MVVRICRLCLTIEEPLQEINEKLWRHYNRISKFQRWSGNQSIKLSCVPCMEALRNNLRFINKCIKSCKLLQTWLLKGKINKPIDSLQYLLLSKQKKEKVKIFNTNNEYDTESSQQIVEVKKENKYDKEDLFEIVNCDVVIYEGDKIKHEEITEQNEHNNEQISNDQSTDVENSENNRIFGNQDNYDVKELQEYVNKTENAVKKGIRIYPRKGISEYLQYATVFDIQLFDTDEDARRELESRRGAEPYASARHRCELCYTVYKCEKLLQFHMKWHDSQAAFECDICRMRFPTKKSERVHRTKCHRGKFACKLCPLVTYYGSAMKAHFEKHQGKTHKCHCGAVFNHISSYLSHARTVHVSTHACVACARTFVSPLGLRNHRARAHPTQSLEDNTSGVQCALCELAFPNQRVYNVHVLSTHKHTQLAADTIACRYCGLSFDAPAQVRAHKRQTHPRKQDANDDITCKLCGAVGVGRSWRYRHYSHHHPQVDYRTVSDAARHMCDQCGKLFTNVTCLREHVSAHGAAGPARPLACAQCGATFPRRAALAAHRRRHVAPRAARGAGPRPTSRCVCGYTRAPAGSSAPSAPRRSCTAARCGSTSGSTVGEGG